MLQDIRDRSRGWLAYVIVAVIAVPLVLFGVYNYFNTGTEGPVAEVGDQEITSRQVDQAFQRQRERFQEMLGERFDPGMINQEAMRRQALDQLIDQAVLMNRARDMGFRISNEALGELIRSQQAFTDEQGNFSQSRYREVLAQNRLSPQAYERDLRVRQAVTQLQRGVTDSVVVTDADLRQAVALQRQRRDIAFLRIESDRFAEDAEITDDEVQAFYEDNRDRFQVPERVKLAYVELTVDALAEQADITEETLRERYESVKNERYADPAARQVRHILIDLPSDAGEEQVAEARAELERMREDITSGEVSFAEMAKQHSADAGSAKKGGDLGFIERGDMVESFEETAFSLDQGEISEPVRSDFGVHLIEVTEVREPDPEPFEAVKEDLREQMIQERLANKFYELGSEVANVAYESPDSLEPVAEQFGLELKHTDWIPRGGTQQGLGSHQKVAEAAFSEDVLEDGYNSELIELSDKRKVVVRVAERQAAKTKPLEAVREQIVETLRRRATTEAAAEKGQALLEQIRQGDLTMESAAENDSVSLNNPGMIQRQNSELPRAVVDTAFRMERPAEQSAALDGASLSDGDYALVRLTAVEDGDFAALDDNAKETIRQELRRARANAAMESLVKSLRAEADITIHENRL